MKLAVSAVVAILLTAAAAHAQAPAPVPDPGKLALARQLIQAQGGEAAMRRQMGAILDSMDKAALASMPPETAKFAAPLQQSIHREVMSLVPTMVDASARAWADNLTDQELRDMIAFQSSPSGQSIQQKTPAVMNELMQTTMPLMAAKMPAVMDDAVRQMCTEQHCTADEQKVIAEAVTHASGRAKPVG